MKIVGGLLGLIWGLSCENLSKKADQRVSSTSEEVTESPPAEGAEDRKVDTCSWKVLSEAEFLALRGERWEKLSSCKQPISSLRKEPIGSCSDRSLFAYTFKVGRHEIQLRDDTSGTSVYTPEGECHTEEGNIVIFSFEGGTWCGGLKYFGQKIFTPLSKEPFDMSAEDVYVGKKGALLTWCQQMGPIVEVVDLRTGDRYVPGEGFREFMEREDASFEVPPAASVPIDKSCAPLKGVYAVKDKKTACLLHIEGEHSGIKRELVGGEYVDREVRKYVRLYLLIEW